MGDRTVFDHIEANATDEAIQVAKKNWAVNMELADARIYLAAEDQFHVQTVIVKEKEKHVLYSTKTGRPVSTDLFGFEYFKPGLGLSRRGIMRQYRPEILRVWLKPASERPKPVDWLVFKLFGPKIVLLWPARYKIK